jgi:hypothetical protein
MGASGAGHIPPGEYEQAQQPPYGYQAQQYDGPRQQMYGPRVVDQQGQVKQPYFEYSKCDGRKKALLVSYWNRL